MHKIIKPHDILQFGGNIVLNATGIFTLTLILALTSTLSLISTLIETEGKHYFAS